jgi:hypothetical protein
MKMIAVIYVFFTDPGSAVQNYEYLIQEASELRTHRIRIQNTGVRPVHSSESEKEAGC